jgi:hypothetical protein
MSGSVGGSTGYDEDSSSTSTNGSGVGSEDRLPVSGVCKTGGRSQRNSGPRAKDDVLAGPTMVPVMLVKGRSAEFLVRLLFV